MRIASAKRLHFNDDLRNGVELCKISQDINIFRQDFDLNFQDGVDVLVQHVKIEWAHLVDIFLPDGVHLEALIVTTLHGDILLLDGHDRDRIVRERVEYFLVQPVLGFDFAQLAANINLVWSDNLLHSEAVLDELGLRLPGC